MITKVGNVFCVLTPYVFIERRAHCLFIKGVLR